jgi:effector-binding domain-containing protein
MEPQIDAEIGWPLDAPLDGGTDLEARELPSGPAAVVTYFGPYDGVGEAYEAIMAWCREHGREPSGSPWESYFTDPTAEPDPAKWRTDVVWPLGN